MKEIVKKNKLIAEFMGFNYRCSSESLDSHYNSHYIQRMNEDGTPYQEDGTLNKDVLVYNMWNPHREWSDLMPIVEKIESLDHDPMLKFKYKVNIRCDQCSIDEYNYHYGHNGIIKTLLVNVINKGDKLKATYEAIVEFIEQYTEQPKKIKNGQVSLSKKEIRRKFREQVLKRDNYKCRGCGITLAELDVHHITDRNKMPNGGYVVENGITLCRSSCHTKAEFSCHTKAEFFNESDGKEWWENFHPNDLYVKINSSKELATEKARL